MIPTFAELKALATSLGYTLTETSQFAHFPVYVLETSKSQHKVLNLSTVHMVLINPDPFAWGGLNRLTSSRPKSRRQP